MRWEYEYAAVEPVHSVINMGATARLQLSWKQNKWRYVTNIWLAPRNTCRIGCPVALKVPQTPGRCKSHKTRLHKCMWQKGLITENWLHQRQQVEIGQLLKSSLFFHKFSCFHRNKETIKWKTIKRMHRQAWLNKDELEPEMLVCWKHDVKAPKVPQSFKIYFLKMHVSIYQHRHKSPTLFTRWKIEDPYLFHQHSQA